MPAGLAHRVRSRPHVGGAGLEQRVDLRGDAALVAHDRCVCRPGDAAALEDAFVVGQRAVEGELLGGSRPGLGDVVVHGHRQAHHDPRFPPAGVGRRLADAGCDALAYHRLENPSASARSACSTM
jgi:hypothetical protein